MRCRIAIVAICLLACASGFAAQVGEVEWSYPSGTYDGRVKMWRDADGNLTWMDENSSGTMMGLAAVNRLPRVVTVATTDSLRHAEFTSIQAAIASITDATSVSPYVILILPGTYVEGVSLSMDYVHLLGCGSGASEIRGTLSAETNGTIRGLCISNYGELPLIPDGAVDTMVQIYGDMQFADCQFKGGWSGGGGLVTVARTANADFDRCYFSHVGSAGARTFSLASDDWGAVDVRIRARSCVFHSNRSNHRIIYQPNVNDYQAVYFLQDCAVDEMWTQGNGLIETTSTPLRVNVPEVYIYGLRTNSRPLFSANSDYVNVWYQGITSCSLAFTGGFMSLNQISEAGRRLTGTTVADQFATPHYTLPHADGSANQIPKTNGAGVVSWAADAGEVPDLWIKKQPNMAVTSPTTITNFNVGGTTFSTGLTVYGTGRTTGTHTFNKDIQFTTTTLRGRSSWIGTTSKTLVIDLDSGSAYGDASNEILAIYNGDASSKLYPGIEFWTQRTQGGIQTRKTNTGAINGQFTIAESAGTWNFGNNGNPRYTMNSTAASVKLHDTAGVGTWQIYDSASESQWSCDTLGNVIHVANAKETFPDGTTTGPMVITFDACSNLVASMGNFGAPTTSPLVCTDEGVAYWRFPVPSRALLAKVVIDRITMYCSATDTLAVDDIYLVDDSGVARISHTTLFNADHQWVDADYRMPDNMSFFIKAHVGGAGTLTIYRFKVEYHLE